MTKETSVVPEPTAPARRAGFKVWHLTLLVAFVAIAIVDIQDHRVTDPTLIGLAAGGFAAYAVLAWLGWRFVGKFETRLGRVGVLALYLATMAGLFLIATIAYLLIEHVYRGGRF